MSACRSCGAEIIWALTENGRRIPIDAEPAERPTGTFRLVSQIDGPPLAVSTAGEPVYLSHFATCPNADQHRRSGASSPGRRPGKQPIGDTSSAS